MARFLIILSLFHLSLGSILLHRTETITAPQFAQFALGEQWAAAAYCPANANARIGVEVECNVGNCPLVDQADTDVVLAIPTTPLTDTAGFISLDHTNRLIVVSFRGSESVRNFLTDLNFSWTAINDLCAGCRGFAGVYLAWSEVRDRVVSTVRTAQGQNPGYRVQVTGHSLGGAIATFATVALRNSGIVADMITFGAPRVGDEKFVQHAISQSPSLGQNLRITHIYDPIPSLPGLSSGYRHISPSYFITAIGTAPVTPGDIVIQEGTEVENPWGPTFEADLVAHANYMGMGISVCWPQDQGIPFSSPAGRGTALGQAMGGS